MVELIGVKYDAENNRRSIYICDCCKVAFSIDYLNDKESILKRELISWESRKVQIRYTKRSD